jgi:hypothetical protein
VVFLWGILFGFLESFKYGFINVDFRVDGQFAVSIFVRKFDHVRAPDNYHWGLFFAFAHHEYPHGSQGIYYVYPGSELFA